MDPESKTEYRVLVDDLEEDVLFVPRVVGERNETPKWVCRALNKRGRPRRSRVNARVLTRGQQPVTKFVPEVRYSRVHRSANCKPGFVEGPPPNLGGWQIIPPIQGFPSQVMSPLPNDPGLGAFSNTSSGSATGRWVTALSEGRASGPFCRERFGALKLQPVWSIIYRHPARSPGNSNRCRG